MEMKFSHGQFSDSYEIQANKQGFTFGDNAEIVQKIGDGLDEAYFQKIITDNEYEKILDRFQKKMLANKKFIKKL